MSITQAMILAAGKGTRMRPLTLTTPKPLVTVAHQPLILWHIERLRVAGITDIAINVGHLGNVIINTLQQMNLGVNLHISNESVLGEPLETAGGIKYALANGHLQDEPFILVNGDVWTEYEFHRLINLNLGDDLGHLLLTINPDHHPHGDFSLMGDRIRPPSDTRPNHTFTGISVLSPKLVATLTAGKTAPLAPYLNNALQKGHLRGELIQDTWIDVGTMERLAQADAYARRAQKNIQ